MAFLFTTINDFFVRLTNSAEEQLLKNTKLCKFEQYLLLYRYIKEKIYRNHNLVEML